MFSFFFLFSTFEGERVVPAVAAFFRPSIGATSPDVFSLEGGEQVDDGGGVATQNKNTPTTRSKKQTPKKNQPFFASFVLSFPACFVPFFLGFPSYHSCLFWLVFFLCVVVGPAIYRWCANVFRAALPSPFVDAVDGGMGIQLYDRRPPASGPEVEERVFFGSFRGGCRWGAMGWWWQWKRSSILLCCGSPHD